MNGENKVYDIICSLGGNCAAVHNLLVRGLRHYSLPFDWTYIKDEQPLYRLAEGFKDGFKNFLRKENLRPLTGAEYNTSHTDRAQYKDEFSGYYYVNHFTKSVPFDTDYAAVKQKMDRRFARLLEKLSSARRALFVLSCAFEISSETLTNLYTALKDIYPQTDIEIIGTCFNCKEEGGESFPGVQIFRYHRPMNDYDFLKTNYGWAFLDKISLVADKKKHFSLRHWLEWKK